MPQDVQLRPPSRRKIEQLSELFIDAQWRALARKHGIPDSDTRWRTMIESIAHLNFRLGTSLAETRRELRGMSPAQFNAFLERFTGTDGLISADASDGVSAGDEQQGGMSAVRSATAARVATFLDAAERAWGARIQARESLIFKAAGYRDRTQLCAFKREDRVKCTHTARRRFERILAMKPDDFIVMARELGILG